MTPGSGGTAGDLVRLCAARGLTVGTAESLTGGALAAAVVAVPGASRCFAGGIVSYSHAVKERVLGVSPELLATRGAVDPDVAEQMAGGARRALGTDWAVATTGVAGPAPHDGHAVGTVFLGISGPAGQAHERLALSGGREQIREETVLRALRLLMTYIGLTAGPQ